MINNTKRLILSLTVASVMAAAFNFPTIAQYDADHSSSIITGSPVGDASLLSSAISVQHDLKKADIVKMHRTLTNDGIYDTMAPTFEVQPSYTVPYSAGQLSSADLQDGLNAMKMLRYLVGLPYENIVLDADETNTAQHKAVLMAKAGFSHHPTKPDDMDDDFFNTANTYNSECIAWASWEQSLASAIVGWVVDDGQNNINHAGHRMILFNPGATKFGFGHAYNSGSFYAAHVRYTWDTTDSYIAWPNSGDFPIQYFIGTGWGKSIEQPWSVSLGSGYKNPDKSKLTITLTRKSDGTVWMFDSSTADLSQGGYSDSNKHLSTNSNSVFFRPDVTTLKAINDGDIFTVELSGIQSSDGSDASIKYDINFFDMAKALKEIPEDEPLKPAITSTQLSGNTITASLEGITENAQLIAASYSADNSIINTAISPVNSGDTSAQVTSDFSDAYKIRLFLWNDLNAVCPITDSVPVSK